MHICFAGCVLFGHLGTMPLILRTESRLLWTVCLVLDSQFGMKTLNSCVFPELHYIHHKLSHLKVNWKYASESKKLELFFCV